MGNKLTRLMATCIMAAALLLSEALGASAVADSSGGSRAQTERSVLAPVPNCFPDYGSVSEVSYNSQFNISSFRVNIVGLPLRTQAQVYVQANGQTLPDFTISSSGGSHRYTINYRVYNVYASVYQGSYHVCAGTVSLNPI